MNEKLIKLAIRQSGGKESFAEMAQDIVDHGAAAGFCSWIYYSDTVDFFKRNRKNIMAFAKESAEDMGISTFEMIKGFGVFRDNPVSDEEIADALCNRNSDDTQIRNVMSWFVLEEAARIFVETDDN